MELDYAVPALLFPAVSLLFLSFTNRFLSYADLIRALHSRWQENRDSLIEGQIANLRVRMRLIRWMQLAGAASLVGSTLCMLFIYLSMSKAAGITFIGAVGLMATSLVLLILEIRVSMHALDLQLHDLEGGR